LSFLELAKINISMLYWGAVHNTQVRIARMLPERVFLRDEVPGGKNRRDTHGSSKYETAA
ncbi:MAG: hypothetical protein PHX99_06430, partial [Synergistaceae bacterium]|nr:hypothetical protein [Synergistaceae bacterium]